MQLQYRCKSGWHYLMFPFMQLKKFNQSFMRNYSTASILINSWNKNKRMEYFKVWFKKIIKNMREMVWQEFAMMTILSMKVCLEKERKMVMEDWFLEMGPCMKVFFKMTFIGELEFCIIRKEPSFIEESLKREKYFKQFDI